MLGHGRIFAKERTARRSAQDGRSQACGWMRSQVLSASEQARDPAPDGFGDERKS
jgi:hypothetical protein